jgi:hypothetical protein
MAINPESSRMQFSLRKQDSENVDKSRELAKSFTSDLFQKIESSGGEQLSSVNELLKVLPSESFIVRRDDPSRVKELLSGKSDIVLTQDARLGDAPYANAVEWRSNERSNGLEQAFLEGHGQYEGVVVVAGYRKSELLKIQKIPELNKSFSDVNRSLSVSVRGELSQRDVAFLIVRTPIDRFNSDDMTPEELDQYEEWQLGPKKPLFIYRAFSFPKHGAERRAA